MNQRIREVAFASEKLAEAFRELKSGKFEEKQLFDFIQRAIEDLKQNPQCGIRIPNKLIPKEYIQKYGINNLWKYNLPNAWRLLYSLTANEIKIVSMILEWMDHKDYEKRFKY
ncbi:MAG TPA: hypothetical protein VI977_00185 [archaeon]|nr:hypothetical protein [archaeon]